MILIAYDGSDDAKAAISTPASSCPASRRWW